MLTIRIHSTKLWIRDWSEKNKGPELIFVNLLDQVFQWVSDAGSKSKLLDALWLKVAFWERMMYFWKLQRRPDQAAKFFVW